MAKVNNEGTHRKTDRLEAWSDAVLAIAITLPIVELKAPNLPRGSDLLEAYVALTPQYLSYALSFVVIGLYWSHSHFSGKLIRETDHGFNLLTLLFLALVSLTPFPTRPFVEHMLDSTSIHVAATVYAGVLTAPSLVWLARWMYAATHDLLDPRLDPAYVRGLTRKYALTTLISSLGTLVCAFIDWRVGFGLTALTVLSYLAPPATPEFKPGQEPQDELEEADEAA